MDWAEVINVVAASLSAHRLQAGGAPSRSPSLLGALTGSAPPSLQRRLAREGAATGDIEPLIYQNELPVRLLSGGLIGISARAVDGWAKEPKLCARDCRVAAVVAVAALSTLRLDRDIDAAPAAQTRQAGWEFGEPRWTAALDSLADRTAQLEGLLRRAAGGRRQTWRQVTMEDRILAEAVAAAVVGGAAAASGLPAREWTFPFHLFCNMGVSAAKLSLTTIERWLGIEFLPGPLDPERTASLAALVADEASALEQGCGCKPDSDSDEIAYIRRGHCRQADHDLRAWLPGERKPGSRTGARYASTLWGWQRRWLGGSTAGSPVLEESLERPRLRSHDVASSVLARRWLSGDRGFGGPVMLYDRILPEFCLACGSKIMLTSRADAAGHAVISRTACCERQQLAYRSEYISRGDKLVMRPKLGIIITWPTHNAAGAGYGSTTDLGPLWVCNRSGQYTLSERHCPSAKCGADGGCALAPVPHGWVLLPLSDAWSALKASGAPGNNGTAGSAGGTLTAAELRHLADICREMQPGREYRFDSAADVWTVARSWSSAEMNHFMVLGKRHGLELLLRCKEFTHVQPWAEQQGNSSGSERIDRDD